MTHLLLERGLAGMSALDSELARADGAEDFTLGKTLEVLAHGLDEDGLGLLPNFVKVDVREARVLATAEHHFPELAWATNEPLSRVLS